MKTPCSDTVIISDLHLGSEISRANAALQMLKAASFRRLILLGDIFCDLNFRRLKKPHWQFLSCIRKLSSPKRQVEVVWVEGNHDHGLSEIMSHLVGVKVYQEYEWEYCGLRHLAIHGHQFDRLALSNSLASELFTSFYLLLQKLDSKQKRLVRLIDRLDTAWLRNSRQVATGAIAHARTRGAQRVFCGHTHQALHRDLDGIGYWNTGCWTKPNSTFVTVGEDGVHIRVYDERFDHCDSGEERGEIIAPPVELVTVSGLCLDGDY
jgi:UDP-2,3-diacylglucosamine pyrophosphatase LpxH